MHSGRGPCSGPWRPSPPLLTCNSARLSRPRHFLAATLYLLFRAEWKAGTWRNPILLGDSVRHLGQLVDAWFILGPLTVLVVVLGEASHVRIMTDKADAGTIPLGVPPVAGLAKSLVLGMSVACMLNPHHVHVLGNPRGIRGLGFPANDMAIDSELRFLTQSPLTPQFWDSTPSLWQLNWHGVCLLVLMVASGALLVVEFSRLRVAHLFLWLTFTYLALRQSQLTLFFVVVAVALAAGYLNALSSRITLSTWTNRSTRLLLTGSGVGRLVCLPLAVAMVVCAWPGWLQLPTGVPGLVRRAEWKIESDPGLERVARVIAHWQESGLLRCGDPGHGQFVSRQETSLRGFAPQDKVFVNSRFVFHKPET